jgi:hypothetical protein
VVNENPIRNWLERKRLACSTDATGTVALQSCDQRAWLYAESIEW